MIRFRVKMVSNSGLVFDVKSKNDMEYFYGLGWYLK